MGFGDPPELEGANSSCHQKVERKDRPFQKGGEKRHFRIGKVS